VTLREAIERVVADAFAAGAEWYAVVQARQDSAAVWLESQAWEQDRRYQLMLRRHQKKATEAVGREITRLIMATPEPRQTTLHGLFGVRVKLCKGENDDSGIEEAGLS